MRISPNDKFGKLNPVNFYEITHGSHKRISWNCECGKIAEIPICQVLSGKTKTCGKCSVLPASHWSSTKYGKLQLLVPKDTHAGSISIVSWLCDCGKTTLSKIHDVTRGHTTSCGNCNLIPVAHWINAKYGKLQMLNAFGVSPGSNKKVNWKCDCGKITTISIYNVTSGITTSCGKCTLQPASYWATQKFGRLRMRAPIDIKPGSNQKVLWDCDCGWFIKSDPYTVTSGKTKSCGSCMRSVHEWWTQHGGLIRNLQYPIQPSQIPSGCFQLLESVVKHDTPIRTLCGVCQSEYKPIWGNIKQGRSMTCGCASNHTSAVSCELANFISSLGVEVKMEYNLSSMLYDIGVESKKLLIEYHGLRWHSRPGSKQRDRKKYDNAINSGWNVIVIYEDEWLHKKSQARVRDFLSNRIKKINAVNLRPRVCDIRHVSSKEVNELYDKYHYIGRVNASSLNYGVFYQEDLIAAASFGHPTRQTSSHLWELLRMCSVPQYRVHGIWSKILRQFIDEQNPESIVSFSDNRLFDGSVYEKIGFNFDGFVLSDYSWVKGSRRYHKSGLRKTDVEKKTGLTESQLREASGYRKLWDLGKKRWVWNVIGNGSLPIFASNKLPYD